MLAACWFGEPAGATKMSRMKKNAVIGISLDLCLVIVRCDEGIGHHTLVEQNVRQDYYSGNPELVSA